MACIYLKPAYPQQRPIPQGGTGKNYNFVILSVLDDGAGIPENELGRIFEKGFTGTNGRNRKKSTGMGLYLCRKLCRKLGLSIYAQSREGEFTQITLEIPREESLQICKAEES